MDFYSLRFRPSFVFSSSWKLLFQHAVTSTASTFYFHVFSSSRRCFQLVQKFSRTSLISLFHSMPFGFGCAKRALCTQTMREFIVRRGEKKQIIVVFASHLPLISMWFRVMFLLELSVCLSVVCLRFAVEFKTIFYSPAYFTVVRVKRLLLCTLFLFTLFCGWFMRNDFYLTMRVAFYSWPSSKIKRKNNIIAEAIVCTRHIETR